MSRFYRKLRTGFFSIDTSTHTYFFWRQDSFSSQISWEEKLWNRHQVQTKQLPNSHPILTMISALWSTLHQEELALDLFNCCPLFHQKWWNCVEEFIRLFKASHLPSCKWIFLFSCRKLRGNGLRWLWLIRSQLPFSSLLILSQCLLRIELRACHL